MKQTQIVIEGAFPKKGGPINLDEREFALRILADFSPHDLDWMAGGAFSEIGHEGRVGMGIDGYGVEYLRARLGIAASGWFPCERQKLKDAWMDSDRLFCAELMRQELQQAKEAAASWMDTVPVSKEEDFELALDRVEEALEAILPVIEEEENAVHGSEIVKAGQEAFVELKSLVDGLPRPPKGGERNFFSEIA